MESRKMYAVVKETHADFNTTNSVVGVTDDINKARLAFRKEVDCEKEQQKKFGYSYDTVDEDERQYTAYNEGYEASDSVHIFIEETVEL